MEPGTGKTQAACELVRSVVCDNVLWLTPYQTRQNLADEIDKCGGIDKLHIVGIESLSSSDRIYLECHNMVTSSNTFLVVDESLKIKNWEAIRTKRILELSKHCEFKLILNGTPLTRNILDLWAQFEFLSPKILHMSLAEYKNTFCEWVKISTSEGGRRYVKEYIKAYHNIDYLYSLIHHYVYECDLVLSVEQQYTDYSYLIGQDEMKIYNELKEKYLDNDMLIKMNNNIFIEMTQKMQRGYCCTEDKFNVLGKIIEDNDNDQMIIYTKYIKSGEEVRRRFPNLCVLTYGKHSYGLNLQRYNTTVYFDKTFDYSQMIQSKFRTFRTGQENDCKYYSMTGNVGLEKMINNNILKKNDLAEYFKKVGIEKIKNEL